MDPPPGVIVPPLITYEDVIKMTQQANNDLGALPDRHFGPGFSNLVPNPLVVTVTPGKQTFLLFNRVDATFGCLLNLKLHNSIRSIAG